MDRSFWSHRSVIVAARDLVCIRLSTYESAKEAEFLKRIFTGRSGELENTTFAVLDSKGKRQLVRAGRSPKRAFDSADDLAKTLSRVAKRNGPSSGKKDRSLPLEANVRLGLNVAACDSLPLLVIQATGKKGLAAAEKALAPVLWKSEFRGRFVVAATSKAKDTAPFKGKKVSRTTLLIVAPDRFGLTGKMLARSTKLDAKSLATFIKKGLAKHEPVAKNHRSHVRQGRREGAKWETVIPITDPGRGPRRR